jgi:hypothetical protein
VAADIYGSWDLTIHRPSGIFPSWLEINPDGTGRYVGIWGSARPLNGFTLTGNQLSFEIPNQYEGVDTLYFECFVEGDSLSGSAKIWDPEPYPIVGQRASNLKREGAPLRGEVVDLLEQGLKGFESRWAEMENHWNFANGVLENSAKGTDLVSKGHFLDFELEAEYCYPQSSNSGIYLRGRYEFQILDDYGQSPSVGSSGAIYGFHAPSENAIHPHLEWNRAVIQLIGREVRVELNGKVVVDATIPGITGGAMDSHEYLPGPILLQGDHGPVQFRKLLLTPISHQ